MEIKIGTKQRQYSIVSNRLWLIGYRQHKTIYIYIFELVRFGLLADKNYYVFIHFGCLNKCRIGQIGVKTTS